MRAWSRRWSYTLGAFALAMVAPLVIGTLLLGRGRSLDSLVHEILAAPAVPAASLAVHVGLVVGLGWMLGRQAERLGHAALTDPLTQLWNRRYLEARLREEVARSGRDGSPLALLVLDLDRMKELNDACGHAAGDRALRDVADALRRTTRASDVVARCGGDEIMVLAPRTTAVDAVVVAKRVQRVLRALRVVRRSGAPITVSVGIADLSGTAARGSDALCAAADGALYRAKAAGPGRVAVAGSGEEDADSGTRLKDEIEAAFSLARRA